MCGAKSENGVTCLSNESRKRVPEGGHNVGRLTKNVRFEQGDLWLSTSLWQNLRLEEDSLMRGLGLGYARSPDAPLFELQKKI